MSLTTDSGLTPADIAACTGNCGNNGNGMWGGDFAWLIILFFIFAWGWGGFGGGFGGNVGGAGVQGALTRGDLCMSESFQDVKRDAQNISDAVQLGFSGLNSTICNQQYDTARMINSLESTVQGGFNSTNVAMLQGFNAIQAQAADCCCKTQSGIEGLKYTIASEDCATRSAIQNGIRDVLENQNANARAVLDKLTAQELAAKDAQITAQQQQIFGLQLKASQGDQTTQIINTLRPFPVASYQVCNPFTGTYGGYQGYGSGCGCGCSVGCGCAA